MNTTLLSEVKSEQNVIVMFADVAGSMQLYNTLGDERAKSIIVGLQSAIASVIRNANGQVQEVTGDEILAYFDSADDSIHCAQKIHQSAQLQTQFVGSPLALRVGIHSGKVIFESGRLFGDTINITSRITALAKGGQTMVSSSLMARLSNTLKSEARQFDETRIKGKSEPVIVYDFPVQASGTTELSRITELSFGTRLRLSYAEAHIELDQKMGSVVMGRSTDSDLIVEADPVSRHHVTITANRNRFVLSDNSTNGTYVYLDNGEALYLRREQMPIWGKGELALGASRSAAVNIVVRFESIQSELCLNSQC